MRRLFDEAGLKRLDEIVQPGMLCVFDFDGTLSPIVPHIAEALWAELRTGCKLRDQSFPKADPAALVQDEIELVIQVNGKLRGNLRVSKDADKASIEQLALAHEAVQKQLNGAAAKKVIVVPGRLVNVVV